MAKMQRATTTDADVMLDGEKLTAQGLWFDGGRAERTSDHGPAEEDAMTTALEVLTRLPPHFTMCEARKGVGGGHP
jgi:hypothetical protein